PAGAAVLRGLGQPAQGSGAQRGADRRGVVPGAGGGAVKRSDRAAPLLVGAMIASMVAGRLETAIGCLVIALGAGIAIGMRPPTRAWLTTLGVGVAIALAVNLVLVPGRPWWNLPFGRHATREGLKQGVLLGLRLCGATVALQGLRCAWPGERAP